MTPFFWGVAFLLASVLLGLFVARFMAVGKGPEQADPDDYCPATGGSCGVCVTTCVDYGRPGAIGLG